MHFHFTPTRASWLNQVEIWFSILAGKSLRGASFTSVTQLRRHIDDFIAAYNTKAIPFVWTKGSSPASLQGPPYQPIVIPGTSYHLARGRPFLRDGGVVTRIALTVFTKPWSEPLEQLADKVAALGVDGVELPIRPGYQVRPENVATRLPEAVRVMSSRRLEIRSIAAPLEPTIVRACGEAGIPIVRSMVAVDLGKAGYADTITEHRRLWDGLVPILDETGVTIGIQNHSEPGLK